jgi:hypothetical protein
MDANQFDRLSRVVATRTSRRAAVKAIASLVLAALLQSVRFGQADAQRGGEVTEQEKEEFLVCVAHNISLIGEAKKLSPEWYQKSEYFLMGLDVTLASLGPVRILTLKQEILLFLAQQSWTQVPWLIGAVQNCFPRGVALAQPPGQCKNGRYCGGACVPHCAAFMQFDSQSCECKCPAGSVFCLTEFRCVEANCREGQSFNDTTCACRCDAGVTCGDSCVDTATDPYNCGECGRQCAEGATCVASDCVASECSDGLTACNGNCVDILTDPQNCGGCGDLNNASVCPEGWSCDQGQCQEPTTGILVVFTYDATTLAPVTKGYYSLADDTLTVGFGQLIDGASDGETSGDGIEDGLVRFENLQPGPYQVYAYRFDSGHVDTERYRRIEVTVGETARLELAVWKPGGNITLNWIDQWGNPLPAAFLNAIGARNTVRAPGNVWAGFGHQIDTPPIDFNFSLGPGTYEIDSYYFRNRSETIWIDQGRLEAVEIGQTNIVNVVVMDYCQPQRQCYTNAECCAHLSEFCDPSLGYCVAMGPMSVASNCGGESTDCSGVCVDLLSDPRHCGQCGNGCSEGSCNGGVCADTSVETEPVQSDTAVLVCDEGGTDCGGFCADLLTDPAHCGACWVACDSGSCAGGACL